MPIFVAQSTIANSKHMETNQISIKRGMDKDAVVYLPWNTTQPLKINFSICNKMVTTGDHYAQ